MARLAKIHTFVLLSALAGAGCDDFHSVKGDLEVHNETDRTISVYYEREYGEDKSQWRWAPIKAWDSETLRIDSGFWDDPILVVYCGHEREYDVDLEPYGYDEVEVYVWDFPVCE